MDDALRAVVALGVEDGAADSISGTIQGQPGYDRGSSDG